MQGVAFWGGAVCGYHGIPAVRMGRGWGCWGLCGADAESTAGPPSLSPPPEITTLSSSQSLVKSNSAQTLTFLQKEQWVVWPCEFGFFTCGLSGWFYLNGSSFAGRRRLWMELPGLASPCAGKPKYLQSHPAVENQELWAQDTKPAFLNFFWVISWVLVTS